MELWTRWSWADAVDGWLDETDSNIFTSLPAGTRFTKCDYDPYGLSDYVDGCFDVSLPLDDAKEIMKMVKEHIEDTERTGQYSANYNELMQDVLNYQLSRSEFAQVMNAIENGEVLDSVDAEHGGFDKWLVQIEYDCDKPGTVPIKSVAFVCHNGNDENIYVLNDMQGAYPTHISEVGEYDWRYVYELQ